MGLSAVLSQIDTGGNEWPIVYYSRSLNTAERKYSVTKQQLSCALVSAVKHFKPHRYAQSLLRTDNHLSSGSLE